MREPAAGNRTWLLFPLRYALAAGTLFSVYCFPYREFGLSERWFDAYLAAYARLAGGVLSLFEHVSVDGTRIAGRTVLEIVKNCDAMEAVILLVAAILAYSSALRSKLAGLALGLTALVAVNLLRICSLYYVRIHWPGSFEFFHAELWPLLLIGFATLEFGLWLRWLNSSPRVRAVPSPS